MRVAFLLKSLVYQKLFCNFEALFIYTVFIMDSIVDYLVQNWTAGIWIIIGGAIVYIYLSLKFKTDKTADKVENLPCDKHSERIGIAETLGVKTADKIENLPCDKHSERIGVTEVLSAKLDGIVQILNAKSGNSIIQARSPIGLTEFGKKIVDETKMQQYIDRNWTSVAQKITEGAKSKEPYDIQQFCFDYAVARPEEVLSPEGYASVKDKAFTEGLALFALLQAAGVILRDKYFKDFDIVEVEEPVEV